jgi:very-short-patch-repair endonuclease
MAHLDMKDIVRTRRRSYKGENHPLYGVDRTPEWREKISRANKGKLKGKTWDEIMGPERAALRRVENSEAMIETNVRLLNDRSSDLERYVAECMPEFQRNQKIGKWVVDLVHPDVKIIVEVNGDYWHGNPKVYPPDAYINGLGMTVGEKNAADAYRNEQLCKMGYDVVVLWESDIKDKSSGEIRRMIRDEVERNLS